MVSRYGLYDEQKCVVNSPVLCLCCWLNGFAGCREASTLAAPNQHWPKCSHSQPAVSLLEHAPIPSTAHSCHILSLTFPTAFCQSAQSFPSTSTRSDDCHQLRLSRCLIFLAPRFNHLSRHGCPHFRLFLFHTFRLMLPLGTRIYTRK